MDLHRHPFDEGTITKLEIFEAYTKEWLPVFVMSPYQHICIFDLFAGTGRDQKKPTKREAFANLLREKLLKKELVTNEDVYLFTLDQGHIPSHAADVLKQLKKEGLLTYDSPSPLVTYEQVFKNHRIINYKLR